jgi:hypothetical protein
METNEKSIDSNVVAAVVAKIHECEDLLKDEVETKRISNKFVQLKQCEIRPLGLCEKT